MKEDLNSIVKYQLGWTFTLAEERAMARAIRSANKFMKTYGKGSHPPMVDTSRYCPGLSPEDPEHTKSKRKRKPKEQ